MFKKRGVIDYLMITCCCVQEVLLVQWIHLTSVGWEIIIHVKVYGAGRGCTVVSTLSTVGRSLLQIKDVLSLTCGVRMFSLYMCRLPIGYSVSPNIVHVRFPGYFKLTLWMRWYMPEFLSHIYLLLMLLQQHYGRHKAVMGICVPICMLFLWLSLVVFVV